MEMFVNIVETRVFAGCMAFGYFACHGKRYLGARLLNRTIRRFSETKLGGASEF